MSERRFRLAHGLARTSTRRNNGPTVRHTPALPIGTDNEFGGMQYTTRFLRPTMVVLLVALGTHVLAQLDMHFFAGDWDFRIWRTADITGDPALTGTWHLESGLDSTLALVGRVELSDGPGVQGGLFTRELITYDGYTKLYTRAIVTNTGATYLFSSKGWQGDKLIWTGTQHSSSGEVELREEIEHTGPGSFSAIFHRKDGGSWVLQSNERLVRKKR